MLKSIELCDVYSKLSACMKKIFLIVMLFLLPLQYSWAMVASYDAHVTQNAQAHFGHHEHQALDSHALDSHADNNDLADNDKSDKNTQKAKIHDHFGYSHLSSGELLSCNLPTFTSEAKQFSIQYLFTYFSSPNYHPERPNWPAFV